ncbi:hypothetical protein C8R45DRAFT_637950 [Mycena sanguinolenta]|nr:hypothetical protein C8R45DRAFT_637950 [Mycena sanguinolenta]
MQAPVVLFPGWIVCLILTRIIVFRIVYTSSPPRFAGTRRDSSTSHRMHWQPSRKTLHSFLWALFLALDPPGRAAPCSYISHIACGCVGGGLSRLGLLPRLDPQDPWRSYSPVRDRCWTCILRIDIFTVSIRQDTPRRWIRQRVGWSCARPWRRRSERVCVCTCAAVVGDGRCRVHGAGATVHAYPLLTVWRMQRLLDKGPVYPLQDCVDGVYTCSDVVGGLHARGADLRKSWSQAIASRGP